MDAEWEAISDDEDSDDYFPLWDWVEQVGYAQDNQSTPTDIKEAAAPA
jgi:hypothetical protein